MIKYELLPEQLLYEGTVSKENFFEPDPLAETLLSPTHDPHYWNRLKNLALDRAEIRRTGFPLSSLLVDRELVITNGTVQAAHFALQYGISMNIAGGTHHAFSNRGEGFCLLNDIAVAANTLLQEGLCRKVLIVDLDVHQGNGTAEIFSENKSVFTFSMHGEKNYPLHKETSDLDIALPDGTGDAFYLTTLKYHLPPVLEQFQPDFIFYLSGVDVLATDKLGRLGMSLAGCRERDAFVLKSCKENKIPVAVSMGGGYSHRISHIVEGHANTYRLAQELYF